MSTEVQTKPKTLLIATPMYGGQCYAPYVRGLVYTMGAAQQLGVSIAWLQMTNESLITRARNELVRVFLEQKADYLLFVDADIGFDAAAVDALLKADKDVVCAFYPKKEVNWDSIARASQAGKHDELQQHGGAFVLNILGEGEVTTDNTGCIEVRHGGTGFMMIKREVFEILEPHVPKYRVSTYKNPDGEYAKPETSEFFATSIDAGGALLSEDFHFCELWRQHGGKVWAQPFVRLNHTGTYTYDGDILKSGGNLK